MYIYILWVTLICGISQGRSVESRNPANTSRDMIVASTTSDWMYDSSAPLHMGSINVTSAQAADVPVNQTSTTPTNRNHSSIVYTSNSPTGSNITLGSATGSGYDDESEMSVTINDSTPSSGFYSGDFVDATLSHSITDTPDSAGNRIGATEELSGVVDNDGSEEEEYTASADIIVKGDTTSGQNEANDNLENGEHRNNSNGNFTSSTTLDILAHNTTTIDISTSEDNYITMNTSMDKSTTLDTSIDESTTLDTSIDESTTPDTLINKSTTLDITMDKSTTLDTSMDKSTSLDTTMDKSTTLATSIDESTTLDILINKSTTMDKFTTLESSIDESTKLDTSIDNSTTLATTMDKSTTLDTSMDNSTTLDTKINKSTTMNTTPSRENSSSMDTTTSVDTLATLDETPMKSIGISKNPDNSRSKSIDKSTTVDKFSIKETSPTLDALAITDSPSNYLLASRTKLSSNLGTPTPPAPIFNAANRRTTTNDQYPPSAISTKLRISTSTDHSPMSDDRGTNDFDVTGRSDVNSIDTPTSGYQYPGYRMDKVNTTLVTSVNIVDYDGGLLKTIEYRTFYAFLIIISIIFGLVCMLIVCSIRSYRARDGIVDLEVRQAIHRRSQGHRGSRSSQRRMTAILKRQQSAGSTQPDESSQTAVAVNNESSLDLRNSLLDTSFGRSSDVSGCHDGFEGNSIDPQLSPDVSRY